MRRTINFIAAAGAIALGQTLAIAQPPGHSAPGGPHMSAPTTTTQTTTTAPGNGQTNGAGYNHMNSGQAKGQPNQSCETTGSPPGNAGSAPGSAFNQDGGTAGGKYAGEQTQNSRNTASVSQYDVACANQPQ